ncbi:extracellular solute-binding protein, partial [Aeromonas caviae]
MHGNKQKRDNFVAVLRDFHTETGIRVQLRTYTDREYKARFPRWLEADTSPDLLNWQGGERLLAYVRQGALRPMDELWQQQDWQTSFGKAMQAAVSWQGHTYALPYSYYHWGLFYSKS